MIKFILLLLILIFIIPIPIKINVLIHNSKITVHIYKFNIYPLKKRRKDKTKNKDKKTAETKNNKLKFKFNLRTLKSLINSLDRNPIKPKFKIKLCMDYSLEDAAHTAQLYSTFWEIIMIPINILNIPLNVNIQKIVLTPKFLNRNDINISLTGIIYINLAKLLFVLFLILRSLFWHKEVKPLRGNYGI